MHLIHDFERFSGETPTNVLTEVVNAHRAQIEAVRMGGMPALHGDAHRLILKISFGVSPSVTSTGAGPIETALPHSDFGDLGCYVCLKGVGRGNRGDIVCSESGRVLHFVLHRMFGRRWHS
jgi:hypothetical protein